MNIFFYASASGRIATILLGVEILLPYLLRGTRMSKALGLAQTMSNGYAQRMWPHYWEGYLLLILSFVHAWIPMSAGHMPRTSLTGLWLATSALVLLFFQLLLGLALRSGSEARRFLRAAHFWTMLAVSVLVLSHLWINSSIFSIKWLALEFLALATLIHSLEVLRSAPDSPWLAPPSIPNEGAARLPAR